MFGVMVQIVTPITQLIGCVAVRVQKVLRTRKIKFYESRYNNFYNYFCSNGCYNDFAHQYAEQIVAIAPRREALETPIDRVEKIKHENEYHSWTETRVVPIE
jgi:hypothetical protein